MYATDLLARFYEIMGVPPEEPGKFTQDSVLELMNRGATVFRAWVEDQWYRTENATVADQAIYNFPPENVRAIRIARDNKMLEPKTVLSLAGRSPRWQLDKSTTPIFWTSDGLPHNQYRLYPTPTVSSDDRWTFAVGTGGTDADSGEIVRLQDSSGANFTMATDPADPGWTDPQAGLLVTSDAFSVDTNDGDIEFISGGNGIQQLWLVKRTDEMDDAGAQVPIRQPYQLAPLWFALWHTYEEEDDHHNSVLAGVYKGHFKSAVEKGRARTDNPLPRLIHMRRAWSPTGSGARDTGFYLRYSGDVVVGSTTYHVDFPYNDV